MGIILFMFSQMTFSVASGPMPFPVFLKAGFSSVLEFEEAPSQVVLGDPTAFQIEKLGKAIVVKPRAEYATTNMFVYFKTKETRLFILTASEDAEPTYFKKFSSIVPGAKPLQKAKSAVVKVGRGGRVTKAAFDKKKDYLTIDFELSADSGSKIIPLWDDIRLRYKDRFLKASKLWSERREVQRDSKVQARLIFTKPNVPMDMKAVAVVIPVKDSSKALTLNLDGKRL